MANEARKHAEEVYFPRDQDICCGRGKGASKHPGNKMFQNIIQCKADEFSECSKKLDKSRIIATIVHELLLRDVRFLKRDGEDKWIVLAEGMAREKTGHAIRDYIVSMKAKKEGKNVMKEKVKATKTLLAPKKKGEQDSFGVKDYCQHDSMKEDFRRRFNTPFSSRRGHFPIPSLPLSLMGEPPFDYRSGQNGIFEAVDLILTQDRLRQKLSEEEILEVCGGLLTQTDEDDEITEWDKPDVQKSFAETASIFPEDWL
jgi:hypothetical protein